LVRQVRSNGWRELVSRRAALHIRRRDDKNFVVARPDAVAMTALPLGGSFVSESNLTPERLRAYLRLLAEESLARVGPLGFDPSDIVQQTLLDAHRDRDRFRGRVEGEWLAWLRRLLACNFADAVRAQGRAKRDAGRVVSLEQALDASSARLESWLAADQSSPSERAVRNEEILRLVEALDRLPEANRRALVLRHCRGLSLAEISAELGRTPQAVAGLLKRGLAELRELFPDGLE
jgi:RNA polymerase sigma-70 factor (ECF subfamily)